MSKGLGASDAPNIAKLSLDDTDEDLFASPGRAPTTQKQTPIATNNVSSTSQQHVRQQSKQDIEEARNAQLRAELEKVREVNKVIEGVTASLSKAKENMETVHKTVNNASTLLATWTRILSQTEHNQRVILNPNFQGASQDLEDIENEEIRRQHEADRRVVEEQRRREEAQRKAEEEERRKAAAVATGTRGVSRTRSVPAAGRARPEAEDEVLAETEADHDISTIRPNSIPPVLSTHLGSMALRPAIGVPSCSVLNQAERLKLQYAPSLFAPRQKMYIYIYMSRYNGLDLTLDDCEHQVASPHQPERPCPYGNERSSSNQKIDRDSVHQLISQLRNVTM